MTYAKDTQVSVAKSKAEVEDLVGRYGADQFMSGSENGRAIVGFRIKTAKDQPPVFVRIILPLPNREDRAFTRDRYGYALSVEKAAEKYEQACRSRWRALALVVKAKLEAVSCGISSIEREFLADVVVANGETVHEVYRRELPALQAGTSGFSLLPAGRS